MNKHKIFATAAAVLLSLTASAQTKLNNTTNAAKIMLPGDTITLGYNNDFAVVPINATCDYTVNSPETWVKVQKDANGNLAMFSEFNVSGVDRYATVTLTSIDSSYTAQFVIDQQPNTMEGAASRSTDRKINIGSATDNQHMDGYGIENSYDSNPNTFYHSPWGGTSTKVTDCSGLSKVSYFANGIILQRDASQQALTGLKIKGEDWQVAKLGDLLFFGNSETGRVTHVGIYLRDGKFIHCSGQVKINSLDPSAPDYLYSALSISRIDGQVGTTGITSVAKHPWYF